MNEEIKKYCERTRALLLKYGVSDEEADNFIGDLKEDFEEAIDKNGDGDVTEEVKDAEKKIEEKGEDTQTEKDRVDESVGEEIAEEGDKDEQTTKDRVDEAEGEEKAIEEKHDEEAKDDAEEIIDDHAEVEEQKEENDQDDRIGRLEAKIDQLFSLLMQNKAEEQKDTGAFERAQSRYGVNAGVFSAPVEETTPKTMTAKEAADTVRRLKNG